MEMRGHEAVGLASPVIALDDTVQKRDEGQSIVCFPKDLCPVNRASRKVEVTSRSFLTRFAWHVVTVGGAPQLMEPHRRFARICDEGLVRMRQRQMRLRHDVRGLTPYCGGLVSLGREESSQHEPQDPAVPQVLA